MAEGILRDTIDEVMIRIACLLFVADMDIPEIEEHLNHTLQVVVNADHINKAQNLDLQTWRTQVKDLVNDLSDLVDDQLRRWSSGTWKKLIFRAQFFYTQYQTLSKIKEVARKLNALSRYCRKNLTHFEATADRETKCLRVLDLHNLGIKDLPASIGYLKHLKYLDLSDNDEKLPRSISRLTNLQTLKLSHCHMLKELPKDLKQLKSLRDLEIKGCLDLTHMPTGMKQMVSLRTLSHFVVSNSPNGGGLEELAGLNQLTEVEILHLERLKLTAPDNNEPDEGSYLKDNTSLECLTLRWDHNTVEEEAPSELQLGRLRPHEELKVLCIVGYLGKQFQSWLSSFNYLVKFSLYNCPSCEYIPPLHTLPNLKILKLQRLDCLQYIDQDSHSAEGLISSPEYFFESLTELSLWDCPNPKLTSWWIETNIKEKFPFHIRSPILPSTDLYACDMYQVYRFFL